MQPSFETPASRGSSSDNGEPLRRDDGGVCGNAPYSAACALISPDTCRIARAS
jgi:hypothetical protein